MCDENITTTIPTSPVSTMINHVFSYIDVPVIFSGGIDEQVLHKFITTGINGGVDAIISANVIYHNPPLERGGYTVLVTVSIASQYGQLFLRFIPASSEDLRCKWVIGVIAKVMVEAGLYRLPGSRKKPNDFYLVNPRYITKVMIGYDGENMTLLTLDAEWIPGVVTSAYATNYRSHYILFRHNDPGRVVLKGLLARMPHDTVSVIGDVGT